ncbi:MAG: hypothetical protein ABIN89_00295 [Chitinophagaceae bacterium]
MKIFRQLFLAACVILLIAVASCQKDSGGEQNLVVETLPLANGHVETPAPGPDFPLRVTVKSAMPSGGVKIDVTARPDGGTVAFFTSSKTTSSGVTDFTITLTPSGVISVVDITVTSVSTSSNKWSGNYKYSRK